MTDVVTIEERPATTPDAFVANVRETIQNHRTLERMDCLPADIDYSLDCEQESGGISHDERAYVDLFDHDTFGWFLPLTRGNASTFPAVVKTRYARWRETASIGQRMALTWGGLEALKWLFNDSVCNVGYHIVHRHAVEGLPDGAEMTVLGSMDLSRDPGMEQFIACARPIVTRAMDDIAIAGPEAFMAARGTLDALYTAAHDRISERNRRVNRMLREYAENTISQAVRMFRGDPAVRTLAQKRKEKSLRKAIARSYEMLGSIAGAETARACLDGDTISVTGRKFDFRLRVANLRAVNHGAIEVFVTDKDAIELASLCIYIESTPALDQMTALILDVTAGNEDEIIRRANIIRSTEAASTHEDFRRIRAAAARAAPLVPLATDGIYEAPTPSRERQDVVKAIEERMADAIDVAAWMPLMEVFGPEFGWARFSSADRTEFAAHLTRPWARNRLAAASPN